MIASLAASYKSACQRARVVTEKWGKENLYCPSCVSDELSCAPANAQAVDYTCPQCAAPFQLKSRASRIGDSIPDAGFYAMMKAIREDRTPNLLVLEYDRCTWRVRNLLLVPQFAFTPSAIFRRKPLSESARRAGWIGCNIILKNIPEKARIPIVLNAVPLPKNDVRARYREILPLKGLGARERGWTLDVLRFVQSLGTLAFSTSDVYRFEAELKRFYPGNRHIRARFGSSCKFLRDEGLLKQIERGMWQLES